MSDDAPIVDIDTLAELLAKASPYPWECHDEFRSTAVMSHGRSVTVCRHTAYSLQGGEKGRGR